jgi:hypothetical protein
MNFSITDREILYSVGAHYFPTKTLLLLAVRTQRPIPGTPKDCKGVYKVFVFYLFICSPFPNRATRLRFRRTVLFAADVSASEMRGL